MVLFKVLLILFILKLVIIEYNVWNVVNLVVFWLFF